MRIQSILLFTLLSIFSINSAWSAKLVFAIDLIRHGDRTPIEVIPTSPYHWAQGLGQLTAEGMQQEFQLGTALRKKYVYEYRLLPPNYVKETMYVRSTDFDRTLMSADSLLLGLYPDGTGPHLTPSDTPALPHAYQPIPIHTVPVDADQIMIDRVTAHPQAALASIATTPEWEQKNAALKSNYSRWSLATGIAIHSLSQLLLLGDTVFIYQKHHAKLPAGLSKADAQQIIAAGHWAFTTLYQSKAIANNGGQKLLSTIATYLQQASNKQTPLRYVLLSGHDTNILSVMSAMHTPLSEPPPYASDLNFALYATTANQYYVEVSYNGQPVTMPGCGGVKCSLSQFMTLAHISS